MSLRGAVGDRVGAIMGMYSQVALRVWNKRLPSTELGLNRSKGYEGRCHTGHSPQRPP